MIHIADESFEELGAWLKRRWFSCKDRLAAAEAKLEEAMLRALSGKRGEVARCMAFSLDHAEAAHEVATCSYFISQGLCF